MPLAKARASAGMFAPIGVAHEVDGGFRVSGRYPFGSGSAHAEFMGGSAMRMRNGEIAPVEDGALPVVAFILPADQVKLKGNWDVMGLRGTGSFDFEVPEQFVDKGATFPLIGAKKNETANELNSHPSGRQSPRATSRLRETLTGFLYAQAGGRPDRTVWVEVQASRNSISYSRSAS